MVHNFWQLWFRWIHGINRRRFRSLSRADSQWLLIIYSFALIVCVSRLLTDKYNICESYSALLESSTQLFQVTTSARLHLVSIQFVLNWSHYQPVYLFTWKNIWFVCWTNVRWFCQWRKLCKCVAIKITRRLITSSITFHARLWMSTFDLLRISLIILFLDCLIIMITYWYVMYTDHWYFSLGARVPFLKKAIYLIH